MTFWIGTWGFAVCPWFQSRWNSSITLDRLFRRFAKELYQADFVNEWRSRMIASTAEFIGTMILVLLGNGVVANVVSSTVKDLVAGSGIQFVEKDVVQLTMSFHDVVCIKSKPNWTTPRSVAEASSL